jgi:excisionase family DNA binding protein
VKRDGPFDPNQIAVKLPNAAKLLDVSPDTFDRHIRASLKVLQVGSTVLVSLAELHQWAEANSHHPLD